MGEKGKTSFRPMIIMMVVSLAIAMLWDKLVFIKNAVHWALDPSVGVMLGWNATVGMLIIILIMTILTTLLQKYATDQKTLKELKKEQKEVQKQMKEFKHHPQKMMELQKKQMSFIPKQFKLSMRSIVYTLIPFMLLYRWFYDYFGAIALETGEPARFFGFMGWLVFYLVFSVIFSMILKKMMKVV